MDSTTEIKMMADGARAVQEALERKGIVVKHSVMLEALSAGFGARNWRTIRDKLNVPEISLPTMESLQGLRWQVDAQYLDNEQQYSGFYAGENPIEAGINAHIERIFADDGEEVEVHTVEDRLLRYDTGDNLRYPFDVVVGSHSEALRTVASQARRHLGLGPKSGIIESDEWDKINAYIELFEQALIDNELFCEQVDDINRFTKEERAFSTAGTCGWSDYRGVSYSAYASDVLAVLLTWVNLRTSKAISQDWQVKLYQAQALLTYAKAELNYCFA